MHLAFKYYGNVKTCKGSRSTSSTPNWNIIAYNMMDLDLTDTSDYDSSQSDSDQDDGHLFDRSIEVARSPSQEDIVSLLECPVCFDLPLPPIKTCIQGHIICADCCCRLNKCPLCQQKIDIGRNFFAENFLNKSVIKCKFKVDGCNEELPGEKMKEHIQNCDFRPLKCKGCNAKVTFSDFENHMLTQHGITKWDLNEDGVRVVVSQKQRKRSHHHHHPHIGIIDEGPVSLKFICTTLLIAAVFTAVVDYYYEIPISDESLFLFLW